jgi:hypothetical protein
MNGIRRSSLHRYVALIPLALLAACGSGTGDTPAGGTGPAILHAVSGTVSGAATSGVTVALSGTSSASATTGAGGTYSFTGLADGAYTVTPSLAGYTFTPASTSVTLAGADATGKNFVAAAIPPATHLISGTVSGAATSGVTVALSGASSATTTTGAGGAYAFTGLADGAYTVTPSLTGYTFTPTSTSVTLAGADATGKDFVAAAAVSTRTISGTVSGAATSGVTVTLSGAASATTTAGAGGTYSFTNLADGAYTVTPSLTGYTFTPASASVTLAGADATGKDFVARSIGFAATGSMLAPRAGAVAARLPSGKVLVAGGVGLAGVTLASAELFDPAGNGGVGAFSATGSMGAARQSHAAVSLPGGKVLVVGGAGPGFVALASAEIFDPAGNGGAGSFSPTGSMSQARISPFIALLPSGKVLVAGGVASSVALTSAEIFDPAGNGGAGSFSSTGSMVVARTQTEAVMLTGGKVLIPGGSSNTAEVFDPGGNGGVGSFSATGTMATVRFSATVTALLNGKALIAGGNGVGTELSELFDPTVGGGAGGFVPSATQASAQQRALATLLHDGRVVITSGGNGGSISPVDIFDPAGNGGAGSFVRASGIVMAASRSFSTATLLSDGRVLYAGGNLGFPVGVVASAEILTPP